MKCAICSLAIQPHEFDIGHAFEAINPISFRRANMHSDCYEMACEGIQQMPSKKPGFENRYDEYLTTKT